MFDYLFIQYLTMAYRLISFIFLCCLIISLQWTGYLYFINKEIETQMVSFVKCYVTMGNFFMYIIEYWLLS